MINCMRCNGSGTVYTYRHHQGGLCFKCNGTGKVHGARFRVGSVYSWIGIERRREDGERYSVTLRRVRILEREHDESDPVAVYRCEVLDDPHSGTDDPEIIPAAHMGPDAAIGTAWGVWDEGEYTPLLLPPPPTPR